MGHKGTEGGGWVTWLLCDCVMRTLATSTDGDGRTRLKGQRWTLWMCFILCKHYGGCKTTHVILFSLGGWDLHQPVTFIQTTNRLKQEVTLKNNRNLTTLGLCHFTSKWFYYLTCKSPSFNGLILKDISIYKMCVSWLNGIVRLVL